MGALTTLSGFPEWLPEDMLVADRLIRTIQNQFELNGFAPLKTRVVEPLDELLIKGETDKEVYILQRLQADEDGARSDLGLHFDLTVPFARFVRENKGRLQFPFRRYQIQEAWRGERPGLGRYREFLQADIDIVAEGKLPLHSDVEVIQTIGDVLLSLPLPEARLSINSRKLLEGVYRALGIVDVTTVLRTVDKLGKIGEEGVWDYLVGVVGLPVDVAEKCLEIAMINAGNSEELRRAFAGVGLEHKLIDEGLHDLCYILDALREESKGLVVADLSIARGLDYYTGTVFEATFTQLPNYPSIVGGGRYDSLVSVAPDEKLPGVGGTIGISRILGVLLHENILQASRRTPSAVLVALISEELRQNSVEIAYGLRRRNIPCEVYFQPDRYGKQIRYADKMGIPFVWFPDEAGGVGGEVKDVRSGQQVPARADLWQPPQVDRRVQIIENQEFMKDLLRDPLYIG